VGQTLSSANPVIVAIFSQTQRKRFRRHANELPWSAAETVK
jgi:hypothetical protein